MALLIGHIFSQGRAGSEYVPVLDSFLGAGAELTDGALGKGWSRLKFKSKIALSNSDQLIDANPAQRKSIYIYSVYLRISVHALVVAEDSAVVDAFLSATVLQKKLPLKRTQVRVADLINDLVDVRQELVLTHIHGRVGGTDALKTMSLWGDDLARSPIFLSLRNSLVGTQCGLKIKDEKKEALRITNEGQISFYDDSVRVTGVESVLRFLFANKYFID